MKRKLLAGALIVICLSLAVGGTLAFFTQSGTAHNVITTGKIDVEIQEWADEDKTIPFPENGKNGVMPGTEITKIVEVKNTGTSPAYIRIKVDKNIELAQDASTTVDTGLLVIDLNTTDWTEKDGYYYYNAALEPGDVTVPLFTSVTFAPSMGNAYQNSTATVDVSVSAVQAANNGTSALTAAGWPE